MVTVLPSRDSFQMSLQDKQERSHQVGWVETLQWPDQVGGGVIQGASNLGGPSQWLEHVRAIQQLELKSRGAGDFGQATQGTEEIKWTMAVQVAELLGRTATVQKAVLLRRATTVEGDGGIGSGPPKWISRKLAAKSKLHWTMMNRRVAVRADSSWKMSRRSMSGVGHLLKPWFRAICRTNRE